MSIDKELLDLKNDIDSLTQKREKAIWEQEQVIKSMQEQLGISAIEDAEKELAKAIKQHQKMEEEIIKLLSKIRNDYNKLLEMAQ